MKHIFRLSLIVAVSIVGSAYALQVLARPAVVPAPQPQVTAVTDEEPEALPDPERHVQTVAVPPVQKEPEPPVAQPRPTASGYTAAMVAQHASAQSCWSSINGNVYDLTGWVNQHPGGRGAILSLCGRDGSDAFNGVHGGQRRPASELAGFLLGPLR